MSGSPLPEQNVKALSCDGLVVWLKAHNVKPESCQIFEGTMILLYQMYGMKLTPCSHNVFNTGMNLSS